MTAKVIDTALLRTSTSPLAADTDMSESSRTSRLYRFKQLVKPHEWDEVPIPNGLEHLILGIPGFLCTKKALATAKEKLTDESTLYVDYGNAFNFGFTKPLTAYLHDYADYLAQKFGDKIHLHGNSLGGFLAHMIAQKNPDIVKRMYLTASPHQLTMNPRDLHEYTNIAVFLSIMKRRPFKNAYDHEMMDLWEAYINGATTAEIAELDKILGAIDIVSFVGTHDTTVNGPSCLYELSEHRRSVAVDSDHEGVVRASLSAMEYLTGKDIHSPFPDHIEESHARIEDVQPLVKKSALRVAGGFVTSSIPDDLFSDIFRGVSNVPSTLLQRTRNTSTALGLEREPALAFPHCDA